MKSCPYAHQKQSLTRRQFLKLAGMTAAGLLAASCQPAAVTPSAVPTAAAKPEPVVAIAKAANYDPKLIKEQVQAMFENIGGIADVLAHGNRVAIKVNLTGGVNFPQFPGAPAIESYMTHPAVVRAVVELLRDSGATKISIVEAVVEKESWSAYGYEEMAKAVDAELVDLSFAEPYKDFADTASSTDPYYYESFKFNPILNEIDAFISISKMKCHNSAGVTHTLKNLFGIVPAKFYALNPQDVYRSAFHGTGSKPYKRVPGVIIDLNQARPVNLGIIDGIWTCEGGEGAWVGELTQVKPGVLIAGKDPVAVDAVATAAMGFKPTTDYPNQPFVNGYNHLNMAYEKGLGTNRLEEIKVVGATIDEVKIPFRASF